MGLDMELANWLAAVPSSLMTMYLFSPIIVIQLLFNIIQYYSIFHFSVSSSVSSSPYQYISVPPHHLRTISILYPDLAAGRPPKWNPRWHSFACCGAVRLLTWRDITSHGSDPVESRLIPSHQFLPRWDRRVARSEFRASKRSRYRKFTSHETTGKHGCTRQWPWSCWLKVIKICQNNAFVWVCLKMRIAKKCRSTWDILKCRY